MKAIETVFTSKLCENYAEMLKFLTSGAKICQLLIDMGMSDSAEINLSLKTLEIAFKDRSRFQACQATPASPYCPYVAQQDWEQVKENLVSIAWFQFNEKQ